MSLSDKQEPRMVHHWVSIFINCKARFLLLCNSKVDSPVDRPGPSNGCGELGPSNGHFFGKGLWLPGRSGKVRSVNIDWISRPRGDRNGLVIPFKHPLVNVYKKLWKITIFHGKIHSFYGHVQ